jgi:SAM-dependent methyltransferase
MAASEDELEVVLSVPAEYRRGSHKGNESESVKSGIALMNWIQKNVRPIKGARILDFGCGVKIAQALVQQRFEHEMYVGLDVAKDMLAYMSDKLADDHRFEFHPVPFQNDMYNPQGETMTPESALPVEGKFDLLLMFSVITHMTPDDSIATLNILRKYAADDGQLVFWAFSDPDQGEDFRDENPDRPLLRALYKSSYLESLIADAGWKIVKTVPTHTKYKKMRYVCTPA